MLVLHTHFCVLGEVEGVGGPAEVGGDGVLEVPGGDLGLVGVGLGGRGRGRRRQLQNALDLVPLRLQRGRHRAERQLRAKREKCA